MANQYLALSLFVMLLSFFIILNSMSKFEDTKASPVLSSLDMAFSSSAVERDEDLSSTKKSVDVSKDEGSTLDQIEGLFENNISNFKVTKNRFGTEMRITMNLEEFEEALRSNKELLLSDAQGQENTFLSTLVSLVQSEETGVPYRMDIVLNLGLEPAVLGNENPELLKQYAQKTASFSRLLEQQGMPQRFISAGLAGNEKDIVELLFRRYEPITIGLVEASEQE